MRGIVRPPLAAAAHPAAAGQHSRPVPRSRLCGGCSPWPPCRPPVPMSRRARTRLSAGAAQLAGAAAGPQRHRGDGAAAPFQIPCAAQDSLPPGRTVAPRRKLRPAVRRRRTNPESGARFLQNSCTRNRKSRPKRRLFSLLDNIGGNFRFCSTRNSPFSSLAERDKQSLFGVFAGK